MLVLLFGATAVYKAYNKDLTSGFDELQHASYTAQIQRDGISTDLNSLRLLDPHTFHFTHEVNYLNHVPTYYFVLGKLGPNPEGRPGAILHFRLLNVALVATGLLFCLMLGARMFDERLAFYAYAIPLFCIPVLPSLAGAINNDNAAFLGVIAGGIAFADKWEMIRGERMHSPRDPVTRAYHFQMDWHLVDSSAQHFGMPRAIGFGIFMEMHLTHLVNNWLGDLGWVQEMETRIGAPMFAGDIARITGAVTRVYEEDGIGKAELMKDIRSAPAPNEKVEARLSM